MQASTSSSRKRSRNKSFGKKNYSRNLKRRLTVYRAPYRPRAVNSKTTYVWLPGGVDNKLVVNQGAESALITFFSKKWNLESLVGYQAYTSLYDQFRIVKIKITFWWPMRPCMSIGNVTTPAAYAMCPPQVWAFPDYDDEVVPTSTESVLTRQGLKVMRGWDKPRKMTIRPKVAMQLYNTATSTAYGHINQDIWVDCQSPGTPWYGLKGMTMTTGSPFPQYRLVPPPYICWDWVVLVAFKNKK